MRSVETTWCAVVLLLAAGCASKPLPEVQTQSAAAPAPQVHAEAQHSFDEARRLLAAGRTADAEARFLALTQSHPQLGGPHAALGTMQLQAGKPELAVKHLEAAVQASPKQAAYLNQLGVAYRQTGQFDKAREAYEAAIALAPEHTTAMLNLGILNDLYLGESARALELYERYLLLTPAGDALVSKWVVDLKNRKPSATLAAKGKS